MYVAVKGGERAIEAAHRWLAAERRGDPEVPELEVAQVAEQLRLAVDRVMNEGSLFDPELAALAIKQARGDLVEAAFLLRAYRTTLPRFGSSEPLDTTNMTVRRRISATYKDLPGGQILGPTFDYTHRLLDFALLAEGEPPLAPAEAECLDDTRSCPRVLPILDHEGLMQPEAPEPPGAEPADLTREPLLFPAGRDLRLQNLARGDEGFLLALGYSTQRGFGGTHPFVGELRIGEVELELVPEELGFPISLGPIELTECEMVNQFEGSACEPAQFTRGYGLAFGHAERRAISMALVDRALRQAEISGEVRAPAEDQEFVLYHSDNVQATGFLEHLKLPHYVDFQGELETIRRLRAAAAAGPASTEPCSPAEGSVA
jgi:alpha-D-ribose 1-methylphosphonate 5-triphosphate synthase subunit PhnI